MKPKSNVASLWEAQSGRCFWCGEPMLKIAQNHEQAWSREHVIPRSLGGISWVLAHRKCNSTRQPPDLPEPDDITRAESLYAALGWEFQDQSRGAALESRIGFFTFKLGDVWPK